MTLVAETGLEGGTQARVLFTQSAGCKPEGSIIGVRVASAYCGLIRLSEKDQSALTILEDTAKKALTILPDLQLNSDGATRVVEAIAEYGSLLGGSNVNGLRETGERDVKKAEFWLRKAMEKKSTVAHYNLGLQLKHQGPSYYRESYKCLKQAAKGFERDFESGKVPQNVVCPIAEANFYVAECLRHGRGVKVNLKRALDWYKKGGDGTFRRQPKLKADCIREVGFLLDMGKCRPSVVIVRSKPTAPAYLKYFPPSHGLNL